MVYKVMLVLSNPLKQSFLIPISYWSIMDGLSVSLYMVTPVFGVNELE